MKFLKFVLSFSVNDAGFRLKFVAIFTDSNA
jgi:hypothetical protein